MDSLADIFARMGIHPTPVDRTGPEQREHVNDTRERVWHAACQRGACRYATPDVSTDEPPWVDSTTTCGGYHGSRILEAETGEVVWRWRPCSRHLAWWEKRKVFKAEQKAGQVNTNAGPKRKPRITEDDESTPF